MGITISLWVTWAGCTKYTDGKHNDGEDAAQGDDDETTPDGDDDDDDDDASDELELAGDLTITKVAIYQGVEAVLYEDGGAPSTLEMPVIVGRDALLRVHVRPDDDFEARRVNGILTITSNDGEDVFEEKMRVEEPSRIADLDTTINFNLDGDLLKQTTEFEVEIREVDEEGPGGGDHEDVRWRSEANGGLDTEATDVLTIVVVPIRYNFDGSGRLPDTSPAQIKRIEDLTMAVYPASDVIVRVDPPVSWNQQISPFSTGDWSDILSALNEMRADANEAPNTYYYGMFEPESSIYSFCSQGCIAGLSLLAFSANDPYFRASVGLGYPGDIASETLVHEVGHAHGRDHAPCGLGGQGSDPNYPYSGAELGTWGYHILDGNLLDPQDTVDMMSYCSPIWVSDYTFYNLYERMQKVAGQAREMPMARSTLRVDADGHQSLQAPREMQDTTGAPRTSARLFDETGALASVTTAAWFPYDHIPGGMAVLDEVLPEGWTAEIDQP